MNTTTKQYTHWVKFNSLKRKQFFECKDFGFMTFAVAKVTATLEKKINKTENNNRQGLEARGAD